MTTTPSTASQAPASISDCQEYRNAKAAYKTAVYGDLAQASADLDSCIDAKLAQAREEGRRDSHETNVTMLNLKLKAEDRAIAAEARAEKAEQYAQVALGIKDSLEARLAEIQRGVEVTDEQIIQRAGEIFGFKPHKQDEVTKARYVDFARWCADPE